MTPNDQRRRKQVRRGQRRARRKTPIRLMPPTFVPMPEEDVAEAVDLLADILIEAIRRREASHDQVSDPE